MFKRKFNKQPIAIAKAAHSAILSGGVVSLKYSAVGDLVCMVGNRRLPAIDQLEICNGRRTVHGHAAIQTFVDLKKSGLPYSVRDEKFFVTNYTDDLVV